MKETMSEQEGKDLADSKGDDLQTYKVYADQIILELRSDIYRLKNEYVKLENVSQSLKDELAKKNHQIQQFQQFQQFKENQTKEEKEHFRYLYSIVQTRLQSFETEMNQIRGKLGQLQFQYQTDLEKMRNSYQNLEMDFQKQTELDEKQLLEKENSWKRYQAEAKSTIDQLRDQIKQLKVNSTTNAEKDKSEYLKKKKEWEDLFTELETSRARSHFELRDAKNQLASQIRELKKQTEKCKIQGQLILNQEKKLREQEQRLQDRDQQLQGLEQKLYVQEKKLLEQEQNLRGLDQRLRNQEKVIVEREHELRDQKKVIVEREHELRDQKKVIAEQEQELRNQEKALHDQDERFRHQAQSANAYEDQIQALKMEVTRLKNVYPLNDLIKLKNSQIEQTQKDLDLVPKTHPQRQTLDDILVAMIEQRDILEKVASEVELPEKQYHTPPPFKGSQLDN